MQNVGQRMYDLAERMFPICRSITGNGLRKSLEIICEELPEIKITEVPTGTQVFDWTVPKEWNISGGWIRTKQGETIVDFNETNLHVVGYSVPVHKTVSREELLEHVYTIPEQPDWIPYVTSYYKERWGFCMTERQKQTLTDDEYEVMIDSTLEDGSLTYGELVLKGETEDEILITTYLCHPSMANDELSGPCVQTELVKYLKSLPKRRYTYRFVWNPETIGSIAYLSKNLETMQQHVKAGFVLSCVGDNRAYSMISSKYADTLADRVLENVLKFHDPAYRRFSFLERGSDERQYGSAGVDLPVCGFCRSKYQQFPEYHSSADNMDLISPEGLQGAYEVMVKVINALENNYHYQMLCKCEPQLGKRGLYPTISKKGSNYSVRTMQHLIAYADGRNDLIGISNILNTPVEELIPLKDKLMEHQLLAIK